MNTANPVIRETALRYRKAGLSVLPIRADGSKSPALSSWKELQSRLPTEEELRQWFGNGLRGVAVVAGAVSGNLAVMDFDDDSAWFAFMDACNEHGYASWTYDLPCAKTPCGHHLYFRAPEPLATQVLARDEAGNTLIEIRGEGAYAIVPPTPAECHPDAKPYQMIRGDLANVPMLDAEQVEDLLALARLLDRKPPEPVYGARPIKSAETRVGDRFNSEGDALALLQRHGWAIVGQRGANVYLRRPGKERGVSATWHEGLRVLYVFTTNAPPFEAGRAYSAFACYALLECNGDFSAAARALAEEFGVQHQRNGKEDDSPVIPSGGVTDWLRENLLSFSDLERMEFSPPDWCVENVIPAVGLVMLAGKKSLGKSWALLELALNLAHGLPVWGLPVPRARKTVYLALEDSPRRLQERRRLASLTSSPNALLCTTWLPPEQGGKEALRELVRTFGAEVIIIDTLSAWRGLGRIPNTKNVWQEEHNLTRELQQLAMELGICIIIAHHKNKSSSNDVDSIAGTGGLSAPVDTVILAQRNRGETDGTFRIFGRDVPEQELALSFVGNRWTVIGDAREYTVSTERRKILEAVRELGTASPREVADLTGLPYGSVKHLLRRMVDAGQLRTREGKYSVADGEQHTHDSPFTVFTHSPVNEVNAVNDGERGERGERNITTSHSPVNGEHQTPTTAADDGIDYHTAVIPLSCGGVAMWCSRCVGSTFHEPMRNGRYRCVDCGEVKQIEPTLNFGG